MRRGEIYYITRRDTIGAEIRKSRPGVIVSNDDLNRHAEVVEVVYLTCQPKKDMPTHATINATGVLSTALCEQIDHVSTDLVGDYCGTCTAEEMQDIDAALLASLGLDTTDDPNEMDEIWEELERLREERDRYAKMVDHLLEVNA
jgi:mRNA interferase MazF